MALSDPKVISATDKRHGKDVVRKGFVSRGRTDRRVRLTATVTLPDRRPIDVPLDVTVLAAPRPHRSL